MAKIYCKYCSKEKEREDFTKNKDILISALTICAECRSYIRKKPESIQNKITRDINNIKSVNKLYNNRKAGRTVVKNCPVCQSEVLVTKKDSAFGHIRYCSLKCRSTTYKSLYHCYLVGLRKRATKTNKDIDLTEDFLINLLENVQNNCCAISKVPIFLVEKGKNCNIVESASLDRIISSKGYTKDNVQWVALGVNYMKLDHDDEDVHELLRRIVKYYK